MTKTNDIFIAYRDLSQTDGAMGPANVSKTLAETLAYRGETVQAVDFAVTAFDDDEKAQIDAAAHVIVILSSTTLNYFAADDDPLKQALLYAVACDKNIIPVTISRKFKLKNASGLERLKGVPMVYVHPVYMPPPASEAPLAPLFERIQNPVPLALASDVLDESPSELTDDLSHHIFLSYKRMDSDTMRRVRTDLESAGFVVWTDELIEKGTPQWQREIEKALRGTATLVCLLSPEAAQSDYVREELTGAKMFKKPIFLALIRGTREECFMYGFMNSQMADFRTEEDYRREFSLLVEAIRNRL